jgi:hypothetical protein
VDSKQRPRGPSDSDQFGEAAGGPAERQSNVDPRTTYAGRAWLTGLKKHLDWRTTIIKLGVPNLHFHDLRRTGSIAGTNEGPGWGESPWPGPCPRSG